MQDQSTTANKLLIQSLSNIVAEKRQRVEALGMINVSSDEAERMRNSHAYSQALSDLWRAADDLRTAISKEKK